MRLPLIALLAAAAAAVPLPAQTALDVENGLLPQIRIRGQTRPMRLEDRMAYYHVPGVSIAVINGGRIEWAKAYGVREAGVMRAVDTATLFQAASISKPIAAAAALQLVRSGALDLTSDVNRWLTSWKVPTNEHTAQRAVTLEGLLSHTAGLTISGFPGYDVDSAVPTVVQILDGARPANTGPVRVAALPGQRYRYSGGGYTVMQQLVVDVTRRPFPDFMRGVMLEPLGMGRSTYEQPLPASMARNAATAHDTDGRALHGKAHVYPEMAAAGLWTTPSDLARFALAIQAAAAGREQSVLTPALVADILTPRARGSYGLGLGVSGVGPNQRFGHDGSNAGFRCELVAFTYRGQGAVVMTNGSNGSALAREILRGVAAAYGWPDYLQPERIPVQLDQTVIRELAGTYRLPDGVEIVVTSDGDAIFASLATEPRVRVWATSDSTFFTEDTGRTVRVERDSARRVTALTVVESTAEIRAPRVR